MAYFFIPGLIIAFAVIVGCSWLSWQLLRQNGRILVRLDQLEKRLDELGFEEPERGGLPPGSPAPDFDLPGLGAERKKLTDFRGQSLLLIFFNPGCGFCRDLVPRLAASRSSQKSEGDQSAVTPAGTNGHPRPLIISTGGLEQNREFFAEHPVEWPVLVQKEKEVSAAYAAKGTPSGYLIDSEGKIASEFALGAERLLALANGSGAAALASGEEKERANRFSNHSLARSKIKRDGLKAGTPAPDFQLPRLDGWGGVSLAARRGRRVLIVFSSPHCEPCNLVAPKLEKFHRKHPELELVMISNGEPDENRAKVKEHGLTFPVALQQSWAVSRLYAIFATPAAYLIDQNGIIANDVAVGTEPIFNLLDDVKYRKEPITA